MTAHLETPPSINAKKRSWLMPAFLILAGVGLFCYFKYFSAVVPASLPNDGMIKIPTGSTKEQVLNQLNKEGLVSDANAVSFWMERLDYKARAGRFKLKSGMSAYALVRHLRNGEQSAVKIVLNNEKSPAIVAGKVGKIIEADSLALLNAFNDPVLLDSLGLKPETLMSIFIPDTYESFWNTSAKGFLNKMLKEHKRFWNAQRLDKAKSLHLSPEQVYTMASIVEGESNFADEQPRVAGAYLNRLERGMKLQADPTVQFALMQVEKTNQFRRLFNKDYQVAHPYNTYQITGLPPGPIGMASQNSLDAVLNREVHNYVFFVAKPDGSNRHNFAETYEAHLVNVKTFQNYLANRK
ncbi:MAG: hypothetical protein RL757_612 [Bacteroidota bacterium]|jgi:UPF0755 protein